MQVDERYRGAACGWWGLIVLVFTAVGMMAFVNALQERRHNPVNVARTMEDWKYPNVVRTSNLEAMCHHDVQHENNTFLSHLERPSRSSSLTRRPCVLQAICNPLGYDVHAAAWSLSYKGPQAAIKVRLDHILYRPSAIVIQDARVKTRLEGDSPSLSVWPCCAYDVRWCPSSPAARLTPTPPHLCTSEPHYIWYTV